MFENLDDKVKEALEKRAGLKEVKEGAKRLRHQSPIWTLFKEGKI